MIVIVINPSSFDQLCSSYAGRLFSSLLPNIMAAMSNDFLLFPAHVCFLKTGAVTFLLLSSIDYRIELACFSKLIAHLPCLMWYELVETYTSLIFIALPCWNFLRFSSIFERFLNHQPALHWRSLATRKNMGLSLSRLYLS